MSVPSFSWSFGKQRVTFRTVQPDDLEACCKLEQASYPADEAASPESLAYRQEHATRYFRAAVLDDDTLIGFCCSTRCPSFEHESMSIHVPTGKLLAIHSVVVAPDHRRHGVATAMLKDYIQTINAGDGIEKIVLIAKANLLSLYVNVGFSVTRPSAIVHGADRWYDLEYTIQQSTLPCFIVDAFANEESNCRGNPAAVVLMPDDDDEQTTKWMQAVAEEFNLSETAFVTKKNNEYFIRFFTPTIEVPLCGHATLASAAVLFQQEGAESVVAFTTIEDQKLTCSLVENVSPLTSRISMHFPSHPPEEFSSEADKQAAMHMLQEAFGAELLPQEAVLFLGKSPDVGDMLVEVDPKTFANLPTKPNFDAFLNWDGYGRGVIVCGREGSDGIDFLSRFFAPKAGINEDPVTGSAHCVLTPYFAAALDKNVLQTIQRSARGGRLTCKLLEDNVVEITGSAVTRMNGHLCM